MKNHPTAQSIPATVPKARTKPRSSSIEQFSDLRNEFLEPLHAYVSRRVPQKALAEDVTAETFRAAFESWHRCKAADPYVWLLGIARRKVVDLYRSKRFKQEVALSQAHDAIAAPSADRPDESLLRSEKIDTLRRIVLDLPEEQREALLLQHVEGLPIDQIAQVMHKSPSTVNGLLQRARQNVHRAGLEYFTESPQRGSK